MKTSVLALLALVLVGCGSDPGPTEPSEVSERPDTSITSPGEESSPPSSDPWVTTIPDDVRLPHQGGWATWGPGSRTPLTAPCVDPPARLRNVRATDLRGLYRGATRAEALGLYRDDAHASEAIRDWRGELRLCGGPGSVSHDGEPVRWFSRSTRIAGADEAWFAYQTSEDVDGVDAVGRDLCLTLVRVGNALYAESVTVTGHLDDDGIDSCRHSGARSVGAVVPRLEVFAAPARG